MDLVEAGKGTKKEKLEKTVKKDERE